MADLNGVPFRQNLVPESKWAIKCPFAMVPKMVTYHNTDNEVSAANEIAYMIRNDNQVSYHLAGDEKEIVQGLLFNRNGWHCGDGRNGYGNRNTIGWELCRNFDRNRWTTNLIDPLRFMYTQTELNTIKAAPAVFERLGLEATVNTVKKHQDWNGKWCPSKILNEKRWDAFQAAIIHACNEYKNKGKVSGTVHEVKAGDTLSAIARAYEIQLGKIVEYNGIKNPDVLSIGQKITIPVDSPKAVEKPTPKKSIEEVALEIANGIGGWGNNPDRARRVSAYGLDASAVQRRVDEIIRARSQPPKKTWREVALDIFNGVGGWGNNPERANKLRAEGYNVNQVQSEVNRLSIEANRANVISRGDRVRVAKLYTRASDVTPVRTTPVNGIVEHIDLTGNWRNRYRLRTTDNKHWLGFARKEDLSK